MSYLVQWQLANDESILRRVTACAASLGEGNPVQWAASQMWVLSALPEWVQKYATSNTDGITDAMILAAVEALRTAEASPPEPTTETPPSPAE
ncbi:hypothetical protein [Leucobacter japonicus]|uniref:hypothetical protein n=1 Tax=Leucobacter japonicus TaxID=1461259 RepID=UPI000AB7EE5A|nr:hypothetical protein [Leucobacter japonicus]